MLNKDVYLLEKAYLSISQPMVSVPSDEEDNEAAEYYADHKTELDAPYEQNDNLEMDGKVGSEVTEPEMGCGCKEECNCGCNEENSECEEDTMAADNLNSVRESAMKIAQHWANGGRLEAWQQQKLAIVMCSLAEIARSLH